MPIRPELRKYYGRAWRDTRARILARAGGRCEQCGVKNHIRVQRAQGWWLDAHNCLNCLIRLRPHHWNFCRCEGHWVTPDGKHTNIEAPRFPAFIRRWVGIILTVAHLNHVAGDDRDENLKALCQWCHLNYDKLHHKETRSDRKDAERPLLGNSSPAPPPAVSIPQRKEYSCE